MEEEEFLLESLPEHVVATMEVRDRYIAALGSSGSGLEFLVDDMQKWKPGQTVTVAFLGGSDTLCREIAEVTKEIADACDIKFDFGGASVRRWSESDTHYGADIRVSFDKAGYFSLVGTDSINPTIGAPAERVGGRANQCSLNLGGFAVNRPANWRGTVIHEFLHALAFHHEHQNMAGDCENEFRWEDDPGYEPTTNSNGSYIGDSQGRRPGIYTYLAGPPNSWGRAKIDHNLRPKDDVELSAGSFDRESIMLYRFPPIFYKTSPSPCAPIGNAVSLSAGDRQGLQHLYPSDGNAALLVEHRLLVIETLVDGGDQGLEAASDIMVGGAGEHLRAALAVYARKNL